MAKELKRTNTLTVLTLNTWGLWLISKRRDERMKHLAAYLSTCRDDVVLLQEVWVDKDAQLLCAAARSGGLVHATHFRSGVFGSGLVTLSRYPIVRHAFWRYAAAGFASAIACGDFYAAKGVGWVRLDTPLGLVDVFNTHLHANYCHDYRLPPVHLRRAVAAAADALAMGYGGKDASDAAAMSLQERGPAPEWEGSRVPDDDDAGTRISQLLELTEVIDLVAGGSSRLLVLGGDLNCKPDTLEVDLLRMRLPQLRDAWAAAPERSTGGDGSSGSSGSSGSEAAPLLAPNPEGFTCKAPGSTFKSYRQVPERIDYVWSNMAAQRAEVCLQLCPATDPSAAAAAATASSSKANGSGKGHPPAKQQQQQRKAKRGSSSTKPLSYSDHFAVRAVLAAPSQAGGGAVALPTKTAAALEASPAKAAQAGSPAKRSPLHLGSSSADGGSPSRRQQQGQGQGQEQGEPDAPHLQPPVLDALAVAAAAAAAAAGGEGATLSVRRRVATGYAALQLLEEGYEAFQNNAWTMMGLGGFLLASVLYFALGMPLLWPDMALSRATLSGAMLGPAAVAVLGAVLVAMGAVGDRSQRRAVQSALRLLRVWLQQQGMITPPQSWQRRLQEAQAQARAGW